VVRRLTLSVEEAGRVFGISRGTAYRLAREDRFPVPIVRIGRRLVVSRQAVEALVGLIDEEALASW
jgi:excisionase family DNA binding protein